MMQSIDVERQLTRELETKDRQRKNFRVATITLTFLAAGLLAGLIVLGAIHLKQAERCDIMSLKDNDPAAAVSQAPPVSRKRLVVTPVGGIKHSFPQYPNTNITHPSFPSPNTGMCEPGSVYGGQQLDDLNHDYMALMQKALSVSAPAQAGEIGDYYHASLQSVFRCGESMDVGQLELVAACKTGYVVDGESVECDEDGSYGGSASASA
ncbi:hypothetical protein F5883DRAFT_529524 [Diaporthe sp. PMI_573]|nr:hypothetical protein F5883DRAFT_529524 [Diaporthaceae sp. PMI_573]